MDFGLSGRVVVVTGGASGIGRATVELAAAQGMKVAILDQSAEQAAEVAGKIVAGGGAALAQTLDVRDTAATDAAIARVEKELGPIYGIVTCAGVSRHDAGENMTDDMFETVMDINLMGSYRAIRAASKGMLARKSGAVVAISSTDGMGGHSGRVNYAASKHAVIGMTRTLAIEWGRHGVRVNAVAPGVVDTPLVRRNLPGDHAESMEDRVPLGRFARGEEQGMVCLFLLSDAASYVNGATIPVDGGLMAGFFTRWHGADYGSAALLERCVYTLREK